MQCDWCILRKNHSLSSRGKDDCRNGKCKLRARVIIAGRPRDGGSLRESGYAGPPSFPPRYPLYMDITAEHTNVRCAAHPQNNATVPFSARTSLTGSSGYRRYSSPNIRYMIIAFAMTPATTDRATGRVGGDHSSGSTLPCAPRTTEASTQLPVYVRQQVRLRNTVVGNPSSVCSSPVDRDRLLIRIQP
jgi:hypothetical protein